MSIRIEPLPLECRSSFISSFIAPPESETIVFSSYNFRQNADFDDSSDFAYLYGGTVSVAINPQSSVEFQGSLTQSTHQAAASKGNWSTSLQTLLDRPTPALPSRLVAGGVVFCAAFATWTMTSQVEEVGRAQGQLIPQGEPYKVHPVVSGKIANVYVHEGQWVKAGQVVAELDNAIALNQVEWLTQEHSNYEKELFQTEALIDKARLEAQTRATIADAEVHAQEAAIAQAEAKIESQDATITKAEQQATTSQTLLSELQTDAAAQEERVARLQYLVEEGALSKDQLFQAQQTLGERQRSITEQSGAIQQTLAESQRSRADLQQVLAESQGLQAQLAQKYAEGHNAQIQAQQAIQQLFLQKTQLQAKIQENEKQVNQAKTELHQLALTAPVDGIVLSLNVRNPGEVVQPGQTVAEVASQKAPLVLVASLPTREAGFAKVGDTTQIKFDAYPYQDYGVIPGKVISISPDTKED
ncbi:MAG TPA: HlyD family efflux transporter periplasmic adaptor subunit, partial [Coleofasciculaceae cyanobacterium]